MTCSIEWLRVPSTLPKNPFSRGIAAFYEFGPDVLSFCGCNSVPCRLAALLSLTWLAFLQLASLFFSQSDWWLLKPARRTQRKKISLTSAKPL